jgi:hypothetical protein
MLTLTGITQAHRDHEHRDSNTASLRGPAILVLCLVLAVAFFSTVYHGPSVSPAPAAAPASVVALAP